MTRARQIAIVGGGPAGAMCGARLAGSGCEVTLYDEHLAWEKPCGGGLTYKAIVAYPFLGKNAAPKKFVNQIELISADGERVRLTLDYPVVIYSRAVLNNLLLERARAAGCRVVRARVTGLDASNPRVRLRAAGESRGFDFAVIAAGARNALLPGIQPLEAADFELTLGYFVPRCADVMQVKFPRGLEGYAWTFPRSDHLSAGICGRMASHSARTLREALEEFLRDEGIATRGAKFYSHVLPAPQRETLARRPIAGENWALAGDAAALVDPVTGEGIYYALRSGDLLAEALLDGRPAEYPARLCAAFAGDLEVAADIAPLFYRGRFLGGEKTTRMVQFSARSPTFRALVSDIFSGAQNYGGLRRRLWMQLGMDAKRNGHGSASSTDATLARAPTVNPAEAVAWRAD